MEEKQQSQVLPTSYQTIHGRSLCCLRVQFIHPNWKKKNLMILGMESPNWDSEVNRGTHLFVVEPFPSPESQSFSGSECPNVFFLGSSTFVKQCWMKLNTSRLHDAAPANNLGFWDQWSIFAVHSTFILLKWLNVKYVSTKSRHFVNWSGRQ